MNKTVELAAHQKQDEKDKQVIADIQRASPLLEVQGENSVGVWRIRGLHNGETVIDVNGRYLKATGLKFYEAYARAVSRGLIKKP